MARSNLYGYTIAEKIAEIEEVTGAVNEGSIAGVLNAATYAQSGTPDKTNTIYGALEALETVLDDESNPE